MSRILISPTAYKGTLSPFEAARVMAGVARRKYPRASVRILPLADGGDGTLDVLSGVLKGKRIVTTVEGPLGKPVRAAWAIVPGRTAVIEMARASGLALIKGKNRIMDASSVGTGQLIKAALDRGCRKIFIGVGGTATGEGGAGALRALGLRYFDKEGKTLSGNPGDLRRLDRVDWRHFDARLRRTRIFVLCDVTNPLLGKTGSARTFGPQKGATPAQVKRIEQALARWKKFAKRDTSRSAGAGAAGALAFGLSAFAAAKLVPGTPFVMKALRWKEAVRNQDIILTGEGRLDQTSFGGKVIGAVVKYKGRARVLVACGGTALSPAQVRKRGVTRIAEMGKAGLKKPAAALAVATEKLIREETRRRK